MRAEHRIEPNDGEKPDIFVTRGRNYHETFPASQNPRGGISSTRHILSLHSRFAVAQLR